MPTDALPYLTSDLPGIGGVIRQRPHDFFVQEIPLYEPGGAGEHLFCGIEKVGLTTFDAVHRIADALHISSRDVGYAGMKDANAVTRQVISIPRVDEHIVRNLNISGLTILWAARHGNKLRLGHLAGNRFAIRIRHVEPTGVVKVRPILDVLHRRGMPNYFGEQRFGRRGNNDAVGAALVRGDHMGMLRLLLGSPDPQIDDAQSLGARAAFDRHDNETAMRLFPRHCGMERRILARLMKTHRPTAAVRAIDQKLRRLWISALQSRLFNNLLARRIDRIDRLIDGDLAMKHENGACFHVENAAVEQARCDAFEISPTGPLVGYRMTLPRGLALAIEEQVFSDAGLSPQSLRQSRERAKGERRALRVRPADAELSGGVDEHGPHVTVAFTLPRGAYATVLLRELMKNDSPGAAGTPGNDEGSHAENHEDQAEN
ncbi:MAG: tRNA pseudouridine(13) synthase TruD [Tepidisphaeraceae bacterium]